MHYLNRWHRGKESACQGRRCRRHRFHPGLGRPPGEGNGNTLQYSCLENPMDRGAWRTIVQGVAKSRTWLSNNREINKIAMKLNEGIGGQALLTCLLPLPMAADLSLVLPAAQNLEPNQTRPELRLVERQNRQKTWTGWFLWDSEGISARMSGNKVQRQMTQPSSSSPGRSDSHKWHRRCHLLRTWDRLPCAPHLTLTAAPQDGQ